MANFVQIEKILDGPRSAVFQVYILSDGSGELNDYVVIDPTQDFEPVTDSRPIMAIQQFHYDLNDFQIRFGFASDTITTPVWTLSPGNSTEVEFYEFGGLFDRSNSLDGNGKLVMSTKGMTLAGQAGSFLVQVKKSTQANP